MMKPINSMDFLHIDQITNDAHSNLNFEFSTFLAIAVWASSITSESLECCAELYKDFVKDFVENRKREFLTGRYLASIALEKLGVQAAHINRDSRGAPIWPPQIIGSISHEKDIIAVYLCLNSEYAGIGIDIHFALSDEKTLTIAKFVESSFDSLTADWSKLTGLSYSHLVNALFCAKEAALKSLPPDSQPINLPAIHTVDITKNTQFENGWIFRFSPQSGHQITTTVTFRNGYYIALAQSVEMTKISIL